MIPCGEIQHYFMKYGVIFSENTRFRPNVGLVLAQRRKRWSNNNATLGGRVVTTSSATHPSSIVELKIQKITLSLYHKQGYIALGSVFINCFFFTT